MEPKPRVRKAWYRPRNVILAVAGLFLAWLGREMYLAITARPGPRVDYFARLGELVAAYQPADVQAADAWPVLLAASDAEFACRALVYADDPAWKSVPLDYSVIGATPRRWSDGSLTYDGIHTWGQVEAKAVEGMRLVRERGVPDLLEQAAALPRATRVLSPPPSGHLVDVVLPELGRFRQLARYNRARMILAGRAGDDAEFIAAFDQTLAIAKFTAAQGLLIDYLVGLAIHSLALSEVSAQLCERRLDEAALRAIVASIERHPVPPIGLAIEGERISTLDTIQWTHTDNGRGGGRLILSAVYGNGMLMGGGGRTGVLGQLSRTPLINLGGIAFADRRETTERAMAFFDGMVRASGARPLEHSTSVFNPGTFETRLSRRFLLLKMILPSLSAALRTAQDHALKGVGTRLMLEIELHRARHGDYPPTLDELGLAAGGMDDPFTGRPFAYRRLEPGPDRYGRRYLLYAVGADGHDDGGRTRGWIPQAALRTNGRGYDFVVNMPRETASDSVDQAAEEPPDP